MPVILFVAALIGMLAANSVLGRKSTVYAAIFGFCLAVMLGSVLWMVVDIYHAVIRAIACRS